MSDAVLPGVPGPLTLQRVGHWHAAVDRLAERCGGRVPLRVLLDDLNRRARRTPAPGRAVLEAWRFGMRDQVDLRWWPQGVSTSADADETGGLNGRRLTVVSWYAKKTPRDPASQGSRLTFLDLASGRYRHVLLVRNDDEHGLAPLPVHAGGLVWYGEHLHVAATGRGFFTCRISDLMRTPHHLKATAFGYRYLLPVRAQYRTGKDEDGQHFRFSFLSHHRSTSSLVAGEYTNSPARSRRLALFPVDDAGLPTEQPGRLLGTGPKRMQGAAIAGNLVYSTVSQGRFTRGSLYHEPVPEALLERMTQYRHATPMGCEDLTYDPDHHELWSVSEHPTVRWVFTMRPAAGE